VSRARGRSFAWRASLCVDETQPDAVVGIDAPVAQERPADAPVGDLAHVQLGEKHRFLFHPRLGENAAVGTGDEARSPELDTTRAARVGLEAGAIGRHDEAAVGDGMRALDGLPGGVLALA